MAATLARFVTLHAIPEAEAVGWKLRFAVMLAHAPGGVVLVFNRFRNVWELPGGLMDSADTPRSCAVRELREEAGCEAGELAWLGIVEVDDGRTHFGAVYACNVEDVSSEFESNETLGVALWTPANAPQPLGESDTALLRRFGVPLAKSPT
jgi:8-oxo-dGTP diphosphatase